MCLQLDMEIAVDQQTRAHDQTFDGVPGLDRQNTILQIQNYVRIKTFIGIGLKLAEL